VAAEGWQMLTEGSEHLVNLDRLENYPAKEAYLTILLAAERAGYSSIPGSRGVIRHCKFNVGTSNPYALIVNNNDLLFYIRSPALNDNPELASQASTLFTDDVLDKTNSQDETRFRIRDYQGAAKLSDWLFSTL
jgi:hypothetical protein